MSWPALQKASSSAAAGIASIGFTTENNTPGSLCLLLVAYTIQSSTVQTGDLSVSDAYNGVWSKAISGWFVPATDEQEYVALFFVANNYGAGKLTANISGYNASSDSGQVALSEYTGTTATTSTVLDVAAISIASYLTSGTMSGPQVVTTAPGDLIYMGFEDWYGNVTAFTSGSGTVLNDDPNSSYGGSGDSYQTQSSAGSITPTMNYTASAGYTNGAILITAAFKTSPAQTSPRLQSNYGQSLTTRPLLPFQLFDTPGSTLMCVVSAEVDQAGTPSGDVTVTDSVGNTWQKIVSSYWEYKSNVWQYNALFYAVNRKGTGAEKITVNVSGWYSGSTYSLIAISEWYSSGYLLIPDGSAYGMQTGTYSTTGVVTLTGPSITPSQNGDLIFAFLMDDSAVGTDTFACESGFAIDFDVPQNGVGEFASEYMMQATAANLSPTFQYSSANEPEEWTIIAVALKATVAGPSPPSQIGFIFRNDNGSESGATSMAAQGTNISAPTGQNVRLRMQIDNNGVALPAENFQLEWQRNNSGIWTKF
jgi:hypothetical protein